MIDLPNGFQTRYKKGHKHPPETLEKIGLKNKGRIPWNKGLKGFRAGIKRPGIIPTGANHWNYLKDRFSLKRQHRRGDPMYVEWRRQVYTRDNFTCKMHNSDCLGKIEAHHILGWSEYPELRYQINNGITLCHAHHPRKRAEEKRLSPYFQDLVSVSK